ncbi:response regulator transcription factor [Salinimicrobium tongyeongense]|uniref:Response regulator transcription factor n=1 Tax=Salinimicrobium tongyeongense TaxID=2809707 RepID=A0ABY6NVC9_9FLAO|nr:LytTR family DNA-binding domain-containing protein [Salinimicrobium tongyeongense]UZH56880.1 response regulator transcription factor [Salinimicrobium tongyeongense]
MKTVIVEDEKPAARRLQRMLEKMGVHVITTLHSVEDAAEWFLKNEHPNLIFLDIQLSDGLSFEIFEHTEVNAPIIFTTAYDEYALQAFKLNSIDYLLKPLDDEELAAALEKFKKNSFASQKQMDFRALKTLLNIAGSDYKKRFSIQMGQHLKLIDISEIVCFYSENKATYLHTNTNRSYLLDSSLDKLETEVAPQNFFRVNRKFIISIHAISDILTYSNLRLEVKLKDYNSEQIIVSRERVKDFKDWLQ